MLALAVGAGGIPTVKVVTWKKLLRKSKIVENEELDPKLELQAMRKAWEAERRLRITLSDRLLEAARDRDVLLMRLREMKK